MIIKDLTQAEKTWIQIAVEGRQQQIQGTKEMAKRVSMAGSTLSTDDIILRRCFGKIQNKMKTKKENSKQNENKKRQTIHFQI